MARKKLPPLTTYSSQLIEMANEHDLDLRDAFNKAGVPLSTYYRSITGSRSITLSVAVKVRRALEQLTT